MSIPLVDLKAQYQSIQQEVGQAINEVLQSARFIHGERTRLFAESFAKYCGAKYGIGTSSGTTAITLALMVKGLKPGDEVITTPSTFIATVESIYETGARPVFVDIDGKTCCLDPSLIEKAITPKTKAILPVHLYGRIAGMKEIMEIAEKHDIPVIEDAAQAHGASYGGVRAPVYETAAYSFYPGKTLGAYGDAGAIITNSAEVFEQASMLIDHGRKKGEKYTHHSLGHNFRMDELQAAILSVKLKHLDEWVRQRREHALQYNRLLRQEIKKPSDESVKEHGMYVYTIRVSNRDELFEKLTANGVQAVIHFPIPLHLQPALQKLGYKEGDFPESEKLSREVLSLPMFPELKQEQIEAIASLVNEWAK